MSRPTTDLTAYDFYLRAYSVLLSSARQIPEALHLLERAIERDPRYGPALAWAAVRCSRICFDGWSNNLNSDRRKGIDLARRALQVAGDDPSIIANAALALSDLGEDVGAMIALIDRALVLNPNFARGWHVSGVLRLQVGQTEIAIEHAEKSLRLSPRARVGMTLAVIGIAHFFARRFEDAASKLRIAVQEEPTFPLPYRFLASCYAHMGRLDHAREVVVRLRTIAPIVIPQLIQFRSPEHRELLLSGLRLAAGEAE